MSKKQLKAELELACLMIDQYADLVDELQGAIALGQSVQEEYHRANIFMANELKDAEHERDEWCKMYYDKISPDITHLQDAIIKLRKELAEAQKDSLEARLDADWKRGLAERKAELDEVLQGRT